MPSPSSVSDAGSGTGVGVYRGPFATEREAVGLARAGIGADIWLSPSFSLALFGSWRLLGFEGRNIGHTLNTGVALAVHW